jgi:regulator of replication initiation timing
MTVNIDDLTYTELKAKLYDQSQYIKHLENGMNKAIKERDAWKEHIESLHEESEYLKEETHRLIRELDEAERQKYMARPEKPLEERLASLLAELLEKNGYEL